MKLMLLCLSGFVVMVIVSEPIKAQTNTSPAALHRIANDYYNWRNLQFPVSSSDAGLHTWDQKLTDYAPAAIAGRRAHVVGLLARVNAMPTAKWKKDDQIDWLLFRAQVAGPVFFDPVI